MLELLIGMVEAKCLAPFLAKVVSAHGLTVLLSVVVLWMIFNWRQAVAKITILEASLEQSDSWKSVLSNHSERGDKLALDLLAANREFHCEAVKLLESEMKLRDENNDIHVWNQRLADENDDLRSQLYESRKALWIERNGPIGNDDVFF